MKSVQIWRFFWPVFSRIWTEYGDLLRKSLFAKCLRIRFDKIDGFIKIYHGTRNVVLLGPEKYDAIYNRIRYPISLKSGTTYLFSHYYVEIKVDSYDSFPIEKIVTLHNVIILNTFVLNKETNTITIRYFKENVRIN